MTEGVSYTPDEVAKILKISRFTVYELIKRGELAAYRIGRKVRVEAKDLDRYKQNAKGAQCGQTPIADEQEQDLQNSSRGLIICGQDAILDSLTRQLEKQLPQERFLRQYIGSIDGLLALYRGNADIVTAHLWDSDTDEYNLPYVRRLLPGHQTVVINLVYRNEGFYVTAGNPLEIREWKDLTKPGIRFINRERGSGARVLLDEQLRKLKLEAEHINGYDLEETSHLAVASCVSRGAADVGLGIEKVAFQVQGLDFIPLKKERYDLVIRKSDLTKPYFKCLLAILQSQAFRAEIGGMGGYDLSQMGEIIAEI